MNNNTQIKVLATYMRGGTSKGVFFNFENLPKEAQNNKIARDKLLLRVIGSADPYKKQIDGMGGATSSTSKGVIVSKSKQNDHDVDYYFAQISIDKPFIDWSGNCGNLSSAVGPFAIKEGLIDNVVENGIQIVRIWQANIKKTILCHVPMKNKEVQEIGDYRIDGVAFLAAKIKLEFMEPIALKEKLFPTGKLIDTLEVPTIGTFKATMITAGIPTIFLDAKELGYKGTELQSDINSDDKALKILETIRAYGAMKMGLISNIKEIKTKQHIPKIALVSKAQSYITSSGKKVLASHIDLNVRALSMQQLHHAMMGTASVAIAVAACIPNTLVNLAAGGGQKTDITFGHPSGIFNVGAEVFQENNKIKVKKVTMNRSARIIMDGSVYVPFDTMK